ncbi:hypothetical protein L6R53_27865 [Myxococcota bacterium]|nr:hypothetical protein [Myxococcota bacterium]
MSTSLEPSAAEYGQALWDALARALEEATPGLGGLEPLREPLALVVGLGLPALVAGVLAVRLWRRWQGRRRDEAPAAHPAATAVRRDPAEALRRALASGEGRAALAALWAWLGRGLTAAGRARWSPELTEREWVDRVRAQDPGWPGLAELEALRGEVVRGAYGPVAPTVEQVAALVPRAGRLLDGDGAGAPEGGA